jgi:hypothetical protein
MKVASWNLQKWQQECSNGSGYVKVFEPPPWWNPLAGVGEIKVRPSSECKANSAIAGEYIRQAADCYLGGNAMGGCSGVDALLSGLTNLTALQERAPLQNCVDENPGRSASCLPRYNRWDGDVDPYSQESQQTAVSISQILDIYLNTVGFGGLRDANRYGVKPYGELHNELSGTGLKAHHLIEKRFAPQMGQQIDDMLSIAVSKTEHQVFTNAWRREIGYVNSTNPIKTTNATRAQIEAAARRIYAEYPAILRSLGL